MDKVFCCPQESLDDLKGISHENAVPMVDKTVDTEYQERNPVEKNNSAELSQGNPLSLEDVQERRSAEGPSNEVHISQGK